MVAPDWVQETFPDGWVFNWDQEKDGTAISIEEVMEDSDTSDTQVESTYTYTITKNGETTVEVDTHVTGLFPINTWTSLIEDAGFIVEMRALLPNEGGYGSWLFVGVTGATG